MLPFEHETAGGSCRRLGAACQQNQGPTWPFSVAGKWPAAPQSTGHGAGGAHVEAHASCEPCSSPLHKLWRLEVFVLCLEKHMATN